MLTQLFVILISVIYHLNNAHTLNEKLIVKIRVRST